MGGGDKMLWAAMSLTSFPTKRKETIKETMGQMQPTLVSLLVL